MLKKTAYGGFLALLTASLILLCLPASGFAKQPPPLPTLTVAAGQTYTVGQTTSYSSVTIGDNATITAPQGDSVTMTVNGVETDVAPGVYNGLVVLTVTKEIDIESSGPGGTTSEIFRTGVYVNGGRYETVYSVPAAVAGGKVTNTEAKNVSITSNGAKFNGFIVTGNSKYTIDNAKINLTGNGGNDCSGWGAGIMSSGNADVTVNNAKIITKGCIRPAIFAGGNSTMHVNNSYIKAYNGTVPAGYTFGQGTMMEVPWMLGITGSCRATNLCGTAKAYYTNDHIISQGWGCLSTDQNTGVNLYAKNCLIETIDSGYGSYSIGNTTNTFDGCQFRVHDMALIMANQAANGVFTNHTIVNSGRFGVMVHGGNTGTLTINKGSVFNTKDTTIQIKSSATTVKVDNARLIPQNGIILQAMVSDDPNEAPGAGPGGPGGPGGASTGPENVHATFAHTTLSGDVVNSMTSLGNVYVTLKDATLKGAITTATAHDAGTPTEAHYYYIGNVINNYCVTNDVYGITATIDPGSNWIVDKTSYLTGLNIAPGAKVTAPKGYQVTMMVKGVETAIKPGTYSGSIILTVTPAVKANGR